jgi:hypothetical protein
MHPYFSTTVQPWQTFNPIDAGMYQRPYPWFDPSGYQAPGGYPAMFNPGMYNPAIYRSPFPGFETNPYFAGNSPYAGSIPRPVFHIPPVSFSPESAPGMSPVGFPGFSVPGYLSPENFGSSFGKTAGNYLPPEFLEFLRAELLRCGKALRTVAPALEHDNADVKEQAHLAATAQFFYALGLLYTRGIIIPPEVPGTSSRAEEPSEVTACEVFGEALERFAREQFLIRGSGRELGELSEKARVCFRALAPDSEQLERVRDESIRLGRKKAVNA